MRTRPRWTSRSRVQIAHGTLIDRARASASAGDSRDCCGTSAARASHPRSALRKPTLDRVQDLLTAPEGASGACAQMRTPRQPSVREPLDAGCGSCARLCSFTSAAAGRGSRLAAQSLHCGSDPADRRCAAARARVRQCRLSLAKSSGRARDGWRARASGVGGLSSRRSSGAGLRSGGCISSACCCCARAPSSAPRLAVVGMAAAEAGGARRAASWSAPRAAAGIRRLELAAERRSRAAERRPHHLGVLLRRAREQLGAAPRR